MPSIQQCFKGHTYGMNWQDKRKKNDGGGKNGDTALSRYPLPSAQLPQVKTIQRNIQSLELIAQENGSTVR